jgi:threonine/homoserine/homoserine lactone efflux protein
MNKFKQTMTLMNYELFTTLIAFAFVSSITPGPNNLMLMSSGANFGFKRTIPHMFGVGLGFVFMLILVGVGLMQLFDAYPLSHQILKVLSVIYLVYLAFKIATAAEPQSDIQSSATPMTFLQAVAFQWINPKAWAVALSAVSIYAPARDFKSVLLVGVIFGTVSLTTISTWTVLGQQLRHLLTDHQKLRIFNITMAALLLSSLYPVFIQ